MKKNTQNGFSLIELLLVVVIIGIIAAIAVPSLQKSIVTAENSSALSALKIMQLAESSLYAQKGRFARLDEVNQFQNGKLGTVVSNNMTRGKYFYEMVPPNPTDDELKSGYIIKLSRNIDSLNVPFVAEINQSGYSSPFNP